MIISVFVFIFQLMIFLIWRKIETLMQAYQPLRNQSVALPDGWLGNSWLNKTQIRSILALNEFYGYVGSISIR